MTTRDGFALDTFLLNREFKEDEDEFRRGRRIGDMIGRLLRGDVWLKNLLAERGAPPRRVMAFTVEPEVIINNALSDQFTVIEVAGRDRPGLLYELTSTLSDLLLDITSAHITTFGEKAVDVFYVTDLTGKKVTQRAAPDDHPRALGAGAGWPRGECSKWRVGREPSGAPAGSAAFTQRAMIELDAAVELIEILLRVLAAHHAGVGLGSCPWG